MSKITKLKLPSVLSFTGSIVPNIGIFYGFDWHNIFGEDDEKIILENENISLRNLNRLNLVKKVLCSKGKGVGTRNDSAAIADTEKNAGSSNLFSEELAYLPEDTNSLLVEFSVIFNDSWKTPTNTNSKEFYDIVKTFSYNYIDKISLKELSKRYAEQIFSKDWLYRNGSVDSKTLIFVTNNRTGKKVNLEQVKELIESALLGNENTCLTVQAFLKMPSNCVRVFPSQLMTSDKEDSGKSKPKQLAQLPSGNVYLGSYKIGNALRRIDDWYDDGAPKLAVSALGVNPEFAIANRKENGKHLYTYLMMMHDINDKLQNNTLGEAYKVEDLHFLVACLILGGVYNGNKKDTSSEK